LPNHIAIAFDLPKETFRHKIFTEYKSNRKHMPAKLAMQLNILKSLLKKMQIVFLEQESFEADDIIGTLAKKFSEERLVDIIILSGDKDYLQLASCSEYINIFIPTSRNKKTIIKKYNRQEIIKEFEIEPKEFIEIKALMGDKSDNIPGVIGIGEKNAFKIIKKYKTIENALEELIYKKNKTHQEDLLCENKDQALLCRKLVSIKTDVDIKIDFDELKIKNFFNKDAIEELNRLGLENLIKKYNI
jgi:DNA polymerase-1